MGTAQSSTKSLLLDKIATTIGDLPTSPHVVSAVMGMTSDLNTELSTLSQAMSADPGLTAKVLRMSNSPFYGRSREVTSLNEAVLILGFSTIRSLVVATSTHSMFKSGSGTLEPLLWRHSLAVALCSRIIARRIGMPFVEEVFLAGLLHDVGVLVLLQKMPKDYGALVIEARDSSADRRRLEEAKFGFTHADIGAAILERWRFPSVLIDAVRLHHVVTTDDPNQPVSPDNDTGRIVAHIVCLADELARSLGYGFSDAYDIDVRGLPGLGVLSLSPEAIGEIAHELNERFAEEQALFG